MIKILDCTLRDGGYINNSIFGDDVIKSIISSLVNAKIDIIEVGSLKDEKFQKGKAIYNAVSDFDSYFVENTTSEFALFLQQDQYNYDKLKECNNKVKHIRCAFHNYDLREGLQLSEIVKDKGYKCHINPINLLGYSEKEIIKLLNETNKIQPETFTIVDTIGSMTERELVKIINLINENLDKNISIGLHLHENLSLSFALSQKFIELTKENKNISIDASLNGMGRLPGNLSIELIVNYLNKYENKDYNTISIIEEIDKNILPIKQKNPWGYSLPYALSAQTKVHRTYVEFLLSKKNLGITDIQKILNLIEEEEKSRFNIEYINKIYENYLKY